MHFRILGCYGGSAPGLAPTSFMINDRIAMDAGALTTGLTLEEQARIRHVFLSHAHFDHLATLPFLLDNLFAALREPITLHGDGRTLEALHRHVFNGTLWPDVTTLSNEHTTLVRLRETPAFSSVELDGLKITAAPMDHTVPCHGYLVEDGRASLFISGDTCSLDASLALIQSAPNLATIILEVSFPNRMEKIASLSRHLTPASFKKVADRLPPNVPIRVTHLKPDCVEEIKGEIDALGLDGVSYLKQGEAYSFPEP